MAAKAQNKQVIANALGVPARPVTKSQRTDAASHHGGAVPPGKRTINEDKSDTAANRKSGTVINVREGERDIRGILKMLAPDLIKVAEQPRTDWNSPEVKEGIKELGRNIQAMRERDKGIERSGIVEPLIVRPDPLGEGFVLTAGERRFRAGTEHVDPPLEFFPVVVQDESRQEAYDTALVENLFRRDLTPVERGEAFIFLMERDNLTVRELAQRMGVAKSAIDQYVQTAKLPTELQRMVDRDNDRMHHALAIRKLDDISLRHKFIKSVEKNDLSLKLVREYVSAIQEVRQLEKDQIVPLNAMDTTYFTHAMLNEAWDTERVQYELAKLKGEDLTPFDKKQAAREKAAAAAAALQQAPVRPAVGYTPAPARSQETQDFLQQSSTSVNKGLGSLLDEMDADSEVGHTESSDPDGLEEGAEETGVSHGSGASTVSMAAVRRDVQVTPVFMLESATDWLTKARDFLAANPTFVTEQRETLAGQVADVHNLVAELVDLV